MSGVARGAQHVEQGIRRGGGADLAPLLLQIGGQLCATGRAVKVCCYRQDGRAGHGGAAGQLGSRCGAAMPRRTNQDDVSFHARRNGVAGHDALKSGGNRFLWRIARNGVLASAFMRHTLGKAFGGTMP